MISLVAAVDKNLVIGHENDLPWYLPEDLKRFRKLTADKPVLMGRKTFESILARIGKPLPGRENIVITANSSYKVPEGVKLYSDLSMALSDYGEKDLFVIGGGQIFKQTIDLADLLYITHVDMEAKGDSYFPEIDAAKWEKAEAEEEKHEGYSFVKYVRKK